jgi:hypothetical protein
MSPSSIAFDRRSEKTKAVFEGMMAGPDLSNSEGKAPGKNSKP